MGDGFCHSEAERERGEALERAGGGGKPRYGQAKVCWAEDEAEARRIAYERWPNEALGGELPVELKLPAHFEQAAQLVTEEDVAESIVCGPDPERHVARIQEYVDAGFDHVYVMQAGPDQEGFFRFYEREVLPRLS